MGRLIDADRLKEVFGRNVVGGNAYFDLIDAQPTVEAIPKADYEEQIKINNKLVNDNEQLRAYITMMQADYKARLKADMAAMLDEIQLQAEENIENIYEKDEDDLLQLAQHNAFADCFEQYNDLIQEKINALRGGNGNE